MRTCSASRPRRPLSPATARSYLLLNQFATPGLGSLLGGRWLAGLGQLLLALVGFGMVTGWFVLWFIHFYNQLHDVNAPTRLPWLGAAGAAAFLLSWLWSWVTSLSLLRQARTSHAAAETKNPRIPPRLGENNGPNH